MEITLGQRDFIVEELKTFVFPFFSEDRSDIEKENVDLTAVRMILGSITEEERKEFWRITFKEKLADERYGKQLGWLFHQVQKYNSK